MRSKGNEPSAEQKAWMSQLAEYGCVVTRADNPQIHHCLGATAKHNKVAIGHWYLLPLAHQLHDISSNRPDNITLHKREFEWRHGTEKELFSRLIKTFRDNGNPIPPEEVIEAIKGYHR